MKKMQFIPLAWVVCALFLLAMGSCTPSLTREQLTPSPTISTPRPTRTPDPRQQVEETRSTPDETGELEAASTLLPAVSAIGPLLIEEFPLAREDAADLQPGSAGQNEQFAEDLPEDIRSGHAQIAADAQPVDIEEANAAMRGSGYALEAVDGTPQLTRNGETVEECLLSDAFQTWEQHWILELNGDVLFDGERLTERRVFDEVYNWQPLAGREFFLYRQNNIYGMYFDGRSLPQRYDEIVRWSCSDQQGADGFNFSAQGTDEAISFFARKSGRWYYVRVTTLE